MQLTSRWTSAALAACLMATASTTLAAASTWPGYRGTAATGSAPAEGGFGIRPGSLTAAWSTPLGPGYSETAVAGSLAVTLFSDGTSDWLIAVHAETGETRWRYRIGPTYKGHDGSHDGPIASPAVANDRVFGLGPNGALFALDAERGTELWRVETTTAHGAEPPLYGFSSSPLVMGDVVVVGLGAPEGKAIAGFDLATGALRWTTGDDTITYHSPIAFEVAGRSHVVSAGLKKLVGLDPASGAVLWSFEHEGTEEAMAAQSLVPVAAGDGRLFLKHKGDSSRMIRVFAQDGAFRVEPLWTAPVLRGSYAVPVYHRGLLFGYTGRILSCVDAKSGELVWRSRDPGDGFVSLVGDLLAVQTKAGSVHLAPATREGWNELARTQADEVAWTAPSFAGGALFVRGMSSLRRLDWKAGATAPVAEQRAASSEFDRFLAAVASASDKTAVVDGFLAGIGAFPLIEWPDRVVFLFRGDARDVGLSSDLLGARREEPLRRVPGTDLFFFDTRLEPDARITYRFVKDFDERVIDSRNPRKTVEDNGQEISWLAMPGWHGPTELAEPPADRRGRLVEHVVDSRLKPGLEIKLAAHLPAGYDASGEQRYPVLYQIDDGKARSLGELDRALDALDGTTTETILAVFLEPIELGPANTAAEFAAQNELSARIIAEEVVPFVDARYRTRAERSGRALAGATFHGTAALETLIRHPAVFGAFAGQSIFLFESDLPALVARIPNASEVPFRLYLDWGQYDLRAVREGWDLAAANRALAAELRRRGYRPGGGETREGHGWQAWKNRSDRLLASLFPRQR